MPESTVPEERARSAAKPAAPSPSRRGPARAVDPSLLELAVFLRLAREWDLRFEKLFRQGGVAKWYSSVGHEATTVAAAAALEPGDALLTLHRDSGAILRYYLDCEELFPGLVPAARRRSGRSRDSRELLYRLACQLLGKADGFSAGFERSFHYAHIDEEAQILHVGMISHLGAMIPVAAGVALAFRQQGRDRVALNFIGDGGTSTADFHEGLNMAAVLRAPLVLVVENNQFAFSTPVSQQYACETLAVRGSAYGIPGVRVDGNDPRAVLREVERAVARARRGEGPSLIEAVVGRMRGHSEGDRSFEEVPAADRERYVREDPVERFERELAGEGLVTAEWLGKVHEACAALVLEVVDRARAAAEPAAGTPRPVFAEALETEAPRPARGEAERAEGGAEVTYLDAIAAAMRDAMREDESVFLLGQDIAEFGGAFGVTRGFVEEFGRERVVNTPIAESGTIGIAAGAAVLGRRPVVEMQFADFVSCGFNQLVNVAAKFYYRTLRPLPLVVRLPAGGGVGAGAFHSQNVEAWFLHVAGLKVVAPAWPDDAYVLLREAIRDPNPVLYCEHKFLYRRLRGPIASKASLGKLVRAGARVVREGTDVSVIAYGWMVHRALEAAAALQSDGISAEVVDLRVLAPLDEETVLVSVRKTGRALVVHEAPLTGGFGGEVAARIAEKAFDHLDAPVRRLGYPDTPVPFHKALEEECLPDAEKIAAAARELSRW
jgi:2-oxoisovalerate dehydrogenase E1 component